MRLSLRKQWAKTLYFVAGGLLAAALIIGLAVMIRPTAAAPASATAAAVPLSPRIAAGDGMTQVYVPAGEFLMGSSSADVDAVVQDRVGYSRDSFKNETPQHKVHLDAFWIDKYEVTNDMFARFVAETAYKTDAEKAGGGIVLDLGSREWKIAKGADWRHPRGPSTDINGLGNHPVVQMSLNDAQAYCRWVGRRLPTEAEWEKAARGTDGRTYPWGNQPPSGRLLNFGDRNAYISTANLGEDDGYAFTSPVGSFPDGASPYGAMDMAGNAWERVADWYDEAYYAHSPARNPAGLPSSDYVIMRGGSWSSPVKYLRAAFRYRYLVANRASSIGFRCASSIAAGMPAPAPARQRSREETSMADFTIADFDAAHESIVGAPNEYLIFGKIPVAVPAADLSPDLAAFLGRWEGYSYAPPVKKDWKYVLVVTEIAARGGKAFFWGGTNLQYPRWVSEISFKVVAGDAPSIQWEFEENGIQKSFTFACAPDNKKLLGWQKVPASTYSAGPIELDRGRSFRVYKDYGGYLAGKRIHSRWYRNKVFPALYGQGYLLYLPEGYEANPKRIWPLIVFLHGAGDRGDNLFLLAKASPFMWIREKGPLPFIIVAPLLGRSEFYGSFSDDYMEGVLEEVLREYRVDGKRIYLTGLSMGGEATYRFALKQPDTFAAIAPLSAYLSSTPDMKSIKSVPVWAIHGVDDPVVPLSVGRKPADALKQAGGNIRFSVLSNHDHDVWTDTYLDPQFYDWLIQHRRP